MRRTQLTAEAGNNVHCRNSEITFHYRRASIFWIYDYSEWYGSVEAHQIFRARLPVHDGKMDILLGPLLSNGIRH